MAIRIITQIGSLPYEDPGLAVEYSLEHDIPFVPELVLKGDAIMDYIRNPEKFSCMDELKKHSFEVLKGQCVGPATLVSMLLGQKDYQNLKEQDITNKAAEIIMQRITAMLALDAKEFILFLDEPGLGQTGLDFRELWTPFFESFSAIWGVHCCDNMDWDKVFESGVKIVSFDASQFDLTRYPKYGSFRQNGGRIAWGVQRREDVKDFRPGDLLTLPCGMSPKFYTVQDCPKELRRLREIAGSICQV